MVDMATPSVEVVFIECALCAVLGYYDIPSELDIRDANFGGGAAKRLILQEALGLRF